nr:hypothetical protein CFP56_16359 [Quercus suber]
MQQAVDLKAKLEKAKEAAYTAKEAAKTLELGFEVAKSKEAIQGGSRPEDKGRGKEVKPLLEAEGLKATLKLKDVVPKAKDAAPKAKEADPKSKEADPKAIVPLVS